MKKILLLSAAAVAMCANAESFERGTGFAYSFDEGFELEQVGNGDEANSQYPASGMQGQASMAEGWGLANLWFTGLTFNGADGAQPLGVLGATNDDPKDAMNKMSPVVEYPAGENALMMKLRSGMGWIGYGNFNFAIPQVDEPVRIRAVYTADITASRFEAAKPFQVKLMTTADQADANQIYYGETCQTFWDQPGWRTTDIIVTPNSDKYYLSFLFDAGGFSLQAEHAFYVREISVVKLSALTGYTEPEPFFNDNDELLGKMGTTITSTAPELTTITEPGAGVEGVAAEAANAPVEYFNLQGIRIAEPTQGIAIRRQGNKVTKVIL